MLATLNTIKFTATVEDAFAEPGDQALPVAQDKWIHIIAYANSGWQHMHLKPGNVADAMRAQGFVVMRSNRQYNTIGDEKVKQMPPRTAHTTCMYALICILTSQCRPTGRSTSRLRGHQNDQAPPLRDGNAAAVPTALHRYTIANNQLKNDAS